MKDELKKLLKKAQENMRSGSKDYYKPLPEEESKMIREYFRSKMEIPIEGNNSTCFYNSEGTLVAKGYTRIVIGDYGPYVEFDKDQIVLDNIKQKWEGSEKKHIKYVWMETKDEAKTKVYWQRLTVPYADYKVGMYYVFVNNLTVED